MTGAMSGYVIWASFWPVDSDEVDGVSPVLWYDPSLMNLIHVPLAPVTASANASHVEEVILAA